VQFWPDWISNTPARSFTRSRIPVAPWPVETRLKKQRRRLYRLKLDQAKRFKELVRNNSKLKRLVAELSLEKQVLKDVAEGNS
jgi:hypothetical protein